MAKTEAQMTTAISAAQGDTSIPRDLRDPGQLSRLLRAIDALCLQRGIAAVTLRPDDAGVCGELLDRMLAALVARGHVSQTGALYALP